MPWGLQKREWSPEPASEKDEPFVYLCDWPGCSDEATRVMGCIKELGGSVAFCDHHATRRAA
jgi:hypothetical protein